MMFCKDCDAPLTDEEARYYEDRCERCECLHFVRVEAWRKGEREDPDLDQMYGADQQGGQRT